MKDFKIRLNTETKFLFSTSGSQSSIEKHNSAIRELNANLVYFTFGRKVSPEEYVALLKSPIARGGAVTGQGLKSGIVPFLDEMDDFVKNTGAVNTVVNKNGKLFGYNTDAFGFEVAIKEHIEESELEIKTAVIYGNGGVSGVAAYVLRGMGIEITMAGRNPRKVDRRREELGLAKFDGPYDLVVNATPDSSNELEQAIGFKEILSQSKMVFDHNMPEKDEQRNYLQEYCQRKGIYFAPGKDMYVPQMIKQWRLFLDGAETKDEKVLKVSEEMIKYYWKV